ncbi:MAG: lipopolysaccharide biosynthesis protein, partial [Parabacteroides sp.]
MERQTQSDNTKRIAKNTLFLYIRMFLMMGVSFFTTREVLRILGVENFGIYNLVGGIVVLFSFLNTAMLSSTQRYLNYELGRKQGVSVVNKVFSSCVTIHVAIALTVFLVAEIIGSWFLNKYLCIPEERMFAANIVYQFSVLGTVVNIIRAPYNAAIISYEQMDVFAYMGIAESFLKLGIVYILFLYKMDVLILYAVLMFIVILLVTLLYYF